MKNRLLLLFFGLIGFLISQTLLIFISTLMLEEKPKDIRVLGGFISFLSYSIIIFFLVKKLKIIFHKKIIFNFSLVMFTLFLGMLFTLIYPLTTIINFLKNFSNSQLLVTKFKDTAQLLDINFLGYFIFLVLFVPILEEVLFRKIILTEVHKKYGSKLALFSSSILFSLIHLKIDQLESAFIAGLLFGYIYLKTNNLFICILLHSIFNFMIYLTVDTSSELPLDNYWLWIYPILIIAIFVSVKRIIKINSKLIIKKSK